MEKVETIWYKSTEPPKEKGYYLTLSDTHLLQEVWYDPELGMWNCYTKEHVEEYKDGEYQYKVLFWSNPEYLKQQLLGGQFNE